MQRSHIIPKLFLDQKNIYISRKFFNFRSISYWHTSDRSNFQVRRENNLYFFLDLCPRL